MKGDWRRWRQEGVAAVADRIRRLDPLFADFAAGLRDFTPFFPLPAVILLVRDWARDGLLLIGDAAHTMSPAGAIGVNVALATAAVAAQEIYPKLGRGPIPRGALARVQELREQDVRTLHRAPAPGGPGAAGIGQRESATALAPAAGACRWPFAQGCFPRLQRRLFFGVPLPPLDPAFSFRAGPPAVG